MLPCGVELRDLTGDRPDLAGTVGVTGPGSGVAAAVVFYPPTDFRRMDEHMPDGCAEFNRLLDLTGCHSDPGSPESLLVGAPIGTDTATAAVRAANPVTYVENTFRFMDLDDLLSGLIKAAVFGLIISVVGCQKGYYTYGGAEGVGRATTRAVVLASIAILISDFFLTKLLF